MDGSQRRGARAARWVSVAVATLVAVLTLTHVAYYFPRAVDDLFISLRYAENLAGGNGAVYNVGERVEGYSGPLWMCLQSLGFVLHVEGVTWTKLLGCTCLLVTQVGLYWLCRDMLGIARGLAWLASLLCAANSYVINWAVLGLDTPLHLMAIVLCPVAVHAYLTHGTVRARRLAILTVTALGLTRPESALYVAVNLGAPLLAVRSRVELTSRARSLARAGAPALAALGVLLLARRAYYGHFVPNTYFVKGSHAGFDVERLAALWDQGASSSEVANYLGGVALLLVFGHTRRAFAPALSALACLVFAAFVVPDWMPSLRHVLPVTLIAPIGWVCLVDALARRTLPIRLAALPIGALLAHAAWSMAVIDNRYSPVERRGNRWILPKSDAKWQNTVLAFRRVEPPHVAWMGRYEMGQISQTWGILETSAEPVSRSWFIGRDIGAAGYYSGVRVFDTDGLFTPAVSSSVDWIEHRRVPDVLIKAAMNLRPLGGEVYEDWEMALGRHPELLEGYRLRLGSHIWPRAFIATDRRPPSADEVKRRYKSMLAKFPTLFHLHTLYGESVGAVVERRYRIVDRELR